MAARESWCDVCGAALPWRLTLPGMAVETAAVVGVALVVIGGLLWLSRRGGGLVSPDHQTVGVISQFPTDVPTFTPLPPPSPTTAPNTPRPPTATPLPAVITHTVASGDTLYGIAQKYGVSGDDIAGANPELQANRNRLSIGQQLRVPMRASAADAAATPEPGVPAAAESTAVAQVPVADALAGAQPGSALSATGAVTQAVAVATHAVSAGETITEVAGAYNMTVDDLVAMNPDKLAARPALLPAGDSLVVRLSAPITDTGSILGADDAAGARAGKGGSNLPPEDVGEVLFPAPALLAPGNRTTVTSAAPILQWSSVGILPAGTYYVVALRDAEDPAAEPRLIWVSSNATAIRVPADVRPALGASANVAWSVSVRRAVSRLFGPDEGVRVSAGDNWRVFTWAP